MGIKDLCYHTIHYSGTGCRIKLLNVGIITYTKYVHVGIQIPDYNRCCYSMIYMHTYIATRVYYET